MLLGQWCYWVEEERPPTGSDSTCVITIKEGKFFQQQREQTAVLMTIHDDDDYLLRTVILNNKDMFDKKDSVECFAIGRAIRACINFGYKRAIVQKPTGETLYQYPEQKV